MLPYSRTARPPGSLNEKSNAFGRIVPSSCFLGVGSRSFNQFESRLERWPNFQAAIRFSMAGVNDGVMGGRSQSGIYHLPGQMEFAGTLSWKITIICLDSLGAKNDEAEER